MDTAETQEAGGVANILVVEDNPVMSQIIGKLLRRYEVKHDHIANGLEAIEAAKENQYDLILMDILMPKLGGVRATKAIRALSDHYAQIPIVAVTARVSERDVDQYLAEGMTSVVKKPINGVNLAEVMREQLGMEAAGSKRLETQPETEAESDAKIWADDVDVLNWETFNEYAAILKSQFRSFLKDYLVAGPDLLSEINDSINEGDAKKVQYHAHKFKSTSQVFGAEEVADLAAKLEIMGKNNTIEHGHKVFMELHFAYERAQRALKQKLVLLQNMG